MNYKIAFDQMEWEPVAMGAQQKVVAHKNNKLRLLRLTYGFEEADWCSKGHTGFVLEGEMSINFGGKKVHYKKGDGLLIESGESNKHKALIAKDKFVELVLMETV